MASKLYHSNHHALTHRNDINHYNHYNLTKHLKNNYNGQKTTKMTTTT